ncbi:MAG: hypothetical protein D3924_12665 [Candidatus Electrothrix sp. AR4]|nr:hypothetical protein [Candidatus Electrothrix sp. AR4]
MPMSPEMQEEEINLHQIVLILRRRYPYLIAIFLCIVLLGGTYSYRQTPLYQAACLIIIEPKDRAPVDFVSIDTGTTNEFLETQKQIITSHKVLSRAADKFNLSDQLQIEKFRKNLSAMPLRNTYLMKISATNPDPKKSALYANTLVEEYIRYNLEDRRASSDNAFAWLSG